MLINTHDLILASADNGTALPQLTLNISNELYDAIAILAKSNLHVKDAGSCNRSLTCHYSDSCNIPSSRETLSTIP